MNNIYKPTILYLCVDPELGGSTASLYNLIDSIRDEINPIVLFRREDSGYPYFVSKGIESYIYPYIGLHEFSENKFLQEWRHPWRWHYVKKVRYDYGCYRYVKKILRGRKIDIVHSNVSPMDIGSFLSRKLSAKHVWHVREYCDLHANFEIYRGIPRLRKKINKASARIAISTAIKEHWQMPEENTWVINDAIRPAKDICYNPKKEKYLLFCSYNLTEAKGTRRSIIAFAKSGMAEQGYVLKLVGNCQPEYKQSLMQTIQEYNLLENVEFVPCQTDVKPLFEKATAYIMASEYEGLGRVTGEAMFFGCPVIAYASGGTMDIVKHGETGYLFNTIDECAVLIKHVCETPQGELIMRAQDFAVKNLSQEVYGPKVMEVYKSLLKG